jgi:flagellar motor switch protein FliN/FliY
MTAGATLPVPFVEAWIPEFVKSVEMFTSTVVAIEDRGADAAGAAPAEGVVWHEQPFSRDDAGRFWIGAPIPAAVRLMGDAAADESSGTALFRELMGQSLKAAAEVLNTGSHPGLKCLDNGGTDAPAESSASQVLWITASGTEPIPLWLHCDLGFAGLLAATPAVAPQGLVPTAAPVAGPAGGPEGLHGIDMPVIVVLGRATLRIAEVLKLAVGSVVELDTRVGEPVDICVQNVVVARGEVVSIRGNYGVRIVEVMRPRTRSVLQSAAPPPSAARATVSAGLH